MQQVDTTAEIFYPKPTFIVPLQASFTVNENDGLQMECRVEPAPDPKLVVEWFFNGKPLDTGINDRLGQCQNKISVPPNDEHTFFII